MTQCSDRMSAFQGLPGRLVAAPRRGRCVLCGQEFTASETLHEQATGPEHVACAVQAQFLLADVENVLLVYTTCHLSPLGEPHRLNAREDEQLAGVVVVPLVARRQYCWEEGMRAGLIPDRMWLRTVQARAATAEEVGDLECRERAALAILGAL